VLVRRNGLGFVFGGERPCRTIDSEVPEPHFGVADALGRLIVGMLSQPATPTVTPLLGGHRWVVIGAVALLVGLDGPLGLFKAGSACN
jgi:hypothetical protein